MSHSGFLTFLQSGHKIFLADLYCEDLSFCHNHVNLNLDPDVVVIILAFAELILQRVGKKGVAWEKMNEEF